MHRWVDLSEAGFGVAALEASARQTGAFRRARAIQTAADLLRLILAYCLGKRGLRSTTAWATAIGLVDISNVALLYRLRQCGDWLVFLIGQTLACNEKAGGPGGPRQRARRIFKCLLKNSGGILWKTAWRYALCVVRLGG